MRVHVCMCVCMCVCVWRVCVCVHVCMCACLCTLDSSHSGCLVYHLPIIVFFFFANVTRFVQCKMEGLFVECGVVTADILTAIRNLDKWAEPMPVDKDLPCAVQLSYPYTKPDPLGVVAIFGAWNYPVQLTLLPLIGAIAAGNAVLLKPSEVSVATSNLLAIHLPKYLDQVSNKSFFLQLIAHHPRLLYSSLSTTIQQIAL